MLNYQAFDEAISDRIDPIRQLFGTEIPASAVSQDANELLLSQFESLTWVFPAFKGGEVRAGWAQMISIELLFVLIFDCRYSTTSEGKAAIEWVEERLLSLLSGYRLPGASSSIQIESGKLFAPKNGKWTKEIRFSFLTDIVPIDYLANVPEVTEIFGNIEQKTLFEAIDDPT